MKKIIALILSVLMLSGSGGGLLRRGVAVHGRENVAVELKSIVYAYYNG